jgi:hypothetical protein
MKKSIKVHPKGRGRPATGRDPAVTIRLPEAVLASVKNWAMSQEDQPPRSQAIRRLVELGLMVKRKARPTGRPSAALVADLAAEAIDSLGPKVKAPARPVGKPGRRLRAQELATKAIEKIIDPAAPPEERTERKRRLTKGPAEFRDARVDQPKAKGK